MNISPDDFDEAIKDILESYSTNVTDAVNNVTDKAAKQLKKAIAADAPVGKGTQSKSWLVTEPNKKLRRYGKRLVVHSDDFRKVHLLEKGHLTRNGSRTKAFRYVSKNEEKILSQYPQNVAKAIKAVK